MVVGRLLSYWEGILSGAMLNFRWVFTYGLVNWGFMDVLGRLAIKLPYLANQLDPRPRLGRCWSWSFPLHPRDSRSRIASLSTPSRHLAALQDLSLWPFSGPFVGSFKSSILSMFFFWWGGTPNHWKSDTVTPPKENWVMTWPTQDVKMVGIVFFSPSSEIVGVGALEFWGTIPGQVL